MSKREVIGFSILLIAYQAPEGVGQRLLQSFPAQAALLLLFFPIAFAVGRRLRGSVARAYALELSRRRIGQLAAMLLLALGAKALALGIGAAADVYQIEHAAADRRFDLALVTAVPMTFFPSIAEDIVARGFWFRLQRVRWTPWRFIVVSSAIYVANHLFRLTLGPLEWLMLFAFGCAYAGALVYSGSLWPAVGLHWGWNLSNALQDSVASVTVRSPDGARLLSAAAHVVLLVVLAVLWQRSVR